MCALLRSSCNICLGGLGRVQTTMKESSSARSLAKTNVEFVLGPEKETVEARDKQEWISKRVNSLCNRITYYYKSIKTVSTLPKP